LARYGGENSVKKPRSQKIRKLQGDPNKEKTRDRVCNTRPQGEWCHRKHFREGGHPVAGLPKRKAFQPAWRKKFNEGKKEDTKPLEDQQTTLSKDDPSKKNGRKPVEEKRESPRT